MSAANNAYLILVLAGFAAFMVTLAFGWVYVLTDPANKKSKP